MAASGQGSWLVDVEGRRFLDFACGIAVTNVGHCHPRVVAAAEAQVRRLIHTSIVTHNERNVELAERLRALVPELVDAQVFFCNTGAETVPPAVRFRPNMPRAEILGLIVCSSAMLTVPSSRMSRARGSANCARPCAVKSVPLPER